MWKPLQGFESSQEILQAEGTADSLAFLAENHEVFVLAAGGSGPLRADLGLLLAVRAIQMPAAKDWSWEFLTPTQ